MSKKQTSGELSLSPAADTIAMRGVLNFRFPAHASLEVRKRVVARFVREAQAKIDQEQQIERDLAAIRRLAGTARRARGAPLQLHRSCWTFEEAASQLGLTLAQVERAVSIGELLSGIVGYERMIFDSEIRRLKALRDEPSAPARRGFAFPRAATLRERKRVAAAGSMTRRPMGRETREKALAHVLDRKVRGDAAGRTWDDVLWALVAPGASSRGKVAREVAREFGITSDAIKKKFPNRAEITRAVAESARLAARRGMESPAVIRARFEVGRIDPAPWVQLDALLRRVQGELPLTPAEVVALATIKMVLHQVRRAEGPGEKK